MRRFYEPLGCRIASVARRIAAIPGTATRRVCENFLVSLRGLWRDSAGSPGVIPMPDEDHSLTFEIESSIEPNRDTAVVKCHGRMVAWGTDAFQEAVKSLLPRAKLIVIDLSDLSFVDSMGLGALVRLYVSARQAGSRLRVEHLGKQVRNVMQITNLLPLLAQAEA